MWKPRSRPSRSRRCGSPGRRPETIAGQRKHRLRDGQQVSQKTLPPQPRFNTTARQLWHLLLWLLLLRGHRPPQLLRLRGGCRVRRKSPTRMQDKGVGHPYDRLRSSSARQPMSPSPFAQTSRRLDELIQRHGELRLHARSIATQPVMTRTKAQEKPVPAHGGVCTASYWHTSSHSSVLQARIVFGV